MSTTEVKSGLNDIADTITEQKDILAKAVSNAGLASTELAGMASEYADVIAEVGAYTPTGEFESLSKDSLDRMTTEFLALKVHADAIAAVDLDS